MDVDNAMFCSSRLRKMEWACNGCHASKVDRADGKRYTVLRTIFNAKLSLTVFQVPVAQHSELC